MRNFRVASSGKKRIEKPCQDGRFFGRSSRGHLRGDKKFDRKFVEHAAGRAGNEYWSIQVRTMHLICSFRLFLNIFLRLIIFQLQFIDGGLSTLKWDSLTLNY